MKSDIQSAWREGKCLIQRGKCPIQNGIFFGDGTVILLDVAEDYSVCVLEKTTFDDLTKEDELYYTHIGAHCESKDIERGIVIFAGSGDWGDAGFVAVIRASDQDLVWLAFFGCSNPMEKVCLVNEVVTAINNNGHVWRFPLAQPEALSVDTSKAWQGSYRGGGRRLIDDPAFQHPTVLILVDRNELLFGNYLLALTPLHGKSIVEPYSQPVRDTRTPQAI